MDLQKFLLTTHTPTDCQSSYQRLIQSSTFVLSAIAAHPNRPSTAHLSCMSIQEASSPIGMSLQLPPPTKQSLALYPHTALLTSTQKGNWNLGTLRVLPIETRLQIYKDILHGISVVINRDGTSRRASALQLPPAMMEDIRINHLLLTTCTFVFHSPLAFHSFLKGLAESEKTHLFHVRFALLASLPHLATDRADPGYLAFHNLMDPGWRGVFRALPATVRNITLDVSKSGVSIDMDDISQSLVQACARFSIVAHIKSKGKVRFTITGCEYLDLHVALEKDTMNSVRSPQAFRYRSSKEKKVHQRYPRYYNPSFPGYTSFMADQVGFMPSAESDIRFHQILRQNIPPRMVLPNL